MSESDTRLGRRPSRKIGSRFDRPIKEDDRLAYIRAYARLDEMVRLHSLGLGSTELLHAQREVIARELREALARD